MLTQYFPPEIAAGGFRMADMIPAWIERGHQVTVVTAMPNYPTGVIPPRFRGRFMIEENASSGARVLRCWLVPGENGRLLSRVASFVSFAFSSLIVALIYGGRADVVVATSPPLTVAAAGRITALLKRGRFVFDVRDLWPEALAALGVLSGFPLRVCEWLETSLYRAADRVVVVSRPFISHVASRKGGESSIRFIPNGVDLDLFNRHPKESREVVRRWLDVPPDATLLAYVGTFGMVHEVESVLPALSRLSEENVYAVFIGDGAGRKRLEARAQVLRLQNVRFPGLQPRERAAAIYAAADIGLSVVRASAAVDKVIACKIFEIMAAGRPVLAVGGAEIRRLIEEAGCGTWVSPDDEEGFVQTVRQHSREARTGSHGQAGRTYIERHSSRLVLGAHYIEVIEDLCGVR